MKIASVFFGIATGGGTLAYQKLAPTGDKADKMVDGRLAAPFNADANDFLYQWGSSRDYNASPGLEKISATLLAINSADDERNPPETGIMDRELKRVKNGKLFLIHPAMRRLGRRRRDDVGQRELLDRLAAKRAVLDKAIGQLAPDHAAGANSQDVHVMTLR